MLATLLLTSLLTIPTTTTEDAVAAQLPSYPMMTCLVSGEALGEGAVDKLHEGQLVRLCCKRCVKEFDKDPAAMAAKVQQAAARKQAAHYPVETCLLSGEQLDDDAIDVVHASRLVRLCCRMCQKEMAEDPAVVMAKLDEAYIAAQLPTYPVTSCPVSGEALDDDAKNLLYGNRLVRLCCGGCVKEFNKTPGQFVAALDRGAKASHGASPAGEADRGHGDHGDHGGRDGADGQGGEGDHGGHDNDNDGDHG